MPQFPQGAPRGAPAHVCDEGPCRLVIRDIVTGGVLLYLTAVAVRAIGVWSIAYSMPLCGDGGVVPEAGMHYRQRCARNRWVARFPTLYNWSTS